MKNVVTQIVTARHFLDVFSIVMKIKYFFGEFGLS